MIPIYGGRVEYLYLAALLFFGFTIHNSRNRMEKKLRKYFVAPNKYAPMNGKTKQMSETPSKW